MHSLHLVFILISPFFFICTTSEPLFHTLASNAIDPKTYCGLQHITSFLSALLPLMGFSVLKSFQLICQLEQSRPNDLTISNYVIFINAPGKVPDVLFKA
jgi:hypothetical protein